MLACISGRLRASVLRFSVRLVERSALSYRMSPVTSEIVMDSWPWRRRGDWWIDQQGGDCTVDLAVASR